MKSPFPGMDPYLEDSAFWRGFHNLLISFITGQLNVNLPQGYAANLEEHIAIEPGYRDIIPDIYVAERFHRPAVPQTGGTAVLDAPETTAPIEVYFNRPNQKYVKIITGKNWDEVVAIIEILNPTNKRAGESRDDYIRKQQDIICSRTHLLEIDLLRAGSHTVAAPFQEESLAHRGPYIISLCRAEMPVPLYVWPVSLRTELPRIKLPLKPGDPDCLLDLQRAFENAYEVGPYARSIDYARPPAVPVEGQDSEWMDSMLREKGLRTAQAGG